MDSPLEIELMGQMRWYVHFYSMRGKLVAKKALHFEGAWHKYNFCTRRHAFQIPFTCVIESSFSLSLGLTGVHPRFINRSLKAPNSDRHHLDTNSQTVSQCCFTTTHCQSFRICSCLVAFLYRRGGKRLDDTYLETTTLFSSLTL